MQLFFLSTSLLSCSSCTFPAQPWNQPFLQRLLAPLSGECSAWIWVLGVCTALEEEGNCCPTAHLVDSAPLYIYIFFKTTAPVYLFIYFFNFYLFYLWLCWVFVSVWGLSLVVASGGHSSSSCTGLSLSRPLLLRSTGSRCAGSAIAAHGPSCSAACGIFPDQGSNPCPLHWQADSQPLRHQGSPPVYFFMLKFMSSHQNPIPPIFKPNTRVYSSLFPFWCVTSPLKMRKLASIILNISAYLIKFPVPTQSTIAIPPLRGCPPHPKCRMTSSTRPHPQLLPTHTRLGTHGDACPT